MIVIKKINNKNISQKEYNKIISALNLNKLVCPKCHSIGFTVHGYYNRHIDIFNRKITIRVVRLKCSSCKSTHVVLIENMLPYSIVTLDVVISVLSNQDTLVSSHVCFLNNKYNFTNFDYNVCCNINRRRNYLEFLSFTT